MLSVKGGTQTWSTAEQTSSMKGSKEQTMDAQEQQQALGGQAIGDVLNKVADPNWVDPSLTKRVGNSQLDKDSFLKLLLAQLKNQDPTNTMKSHEMAAQLAQFTQLEKLTGIESGIDKLNTTKNPEMNYGALDMIGKEVQGDSTKIIRASEEEQHDITYQLLGEAQMGELQIRDANNEVIRKQTLTGLKKGENQFAWNGLDDEGNKMPKGQYTVTVEAKDMAGKKIGVESGFRGVITGVNFTANGPELMIGNRKVRLKDVKTFAIPGAGAAQQAAAQQAAQAAQARIGGGIVPPPANSTQVQAPKVAQASKEPAAMNSDLMQNISMSSGMKNKIGKETAK